MATTLTVGGTAYTQAGRRAANYLIDGWGWDVDSGYWLEFHEHSSGPQPVITGPVAVSLADGGTTLFAGDLVSASPAIDAAGRRTWGYRCLGLEYRANWIPVTGTDGTGLIRFNTSPTDQLHYVASMAGQSVGQILSYCLTQHASALSAAGITTDATTTSELAALTLVPNEEVQVAGPRLWQAMQQVLQRWARNIRLVATAAGLVRLVDVTTGAAHTLTLGSDPVDPPAFSRNWTSCATRVTVRGMGLIEPGYVSTLRGTLTPAWTGAEQTSWTYSAFTNPTGKDTDHGTVNTVSSATTVVVQSSDATRTWATNFWSGTIQAWIYLVNDATGTGLTYQEARPITACGAMTAGGTCTITVAYALTNSGTSAYNKYQIIGTNVPLASGGLYDVWRLYNVTDPGGQIANHLVPNFPAAVPFVGYNGQGATLTTAPMCQIVGPTSSASAPFQVLPQTGQVLFTRPTVEALNSGGQLNSGVYTTPTDVYMLLAYSRGALTTSYPAGSYSGTAYSQAGLSRIGYEDMYNWTYYGNQSVVNGLAQMLQVSLSNTQIEGTVSYKGEWTTPRDPSGGHLLSIAAVGYTTGDESLSIPIRGYSVRYQNEGGGLLKLTTLRCSNRQDPRTGEGYYDHLSVLGSGGWGNGETIAAGAPQFVGMSGWSLDSSSGPAPSMEFGDDRQGPYRKASERHRAALDDKRRRDAAAEKAARERHDGPRLTTTESEREEGAYERDAVDRDARESADRLARKDNASRRRVMDPDYESDRQRDAASAEERDNRERVVKRDNARRAKVLDTYRPFDDAAAMQGPGPAADGATTGGG